MKIIALATEKGGVGKSTTAVHLAWYCAELKKSVVVIDLDPQGNSSFVLEESVTEIQASHLFKPDTLPRIVPNAATNIALIPADKGALANLERAPMDVIETFMEQVQSLADRFDVCIIDNGPSLGLKTLAALFASQYVVSPVEVETFSIQGTTELLKTVRGVEERKRQAGLTLEFVGMLPNKVNNTSPMHRDNLKALVTAYPDKVIPAKLSQRTSIGEALSEQRPVWSLTKSAAREAAREMRQALALIVKRVQLVQEGGEQ